MNKEVKTLIKPPEQPTKYDLIAALQAGQLVLLANGWTQGTLFETKIEDGKAMTAYCMLGALSSAGSVMPIPEKVNEICIEMAGASLSNVNDKICKTKQDALDFMDKMIRYIDEKK